MNRMISRRAPDQLGVIMARDRREARQGARRHCITSVVGERDSGGRAVPQSLHSDERKGKRNPGFGVFHR